MRADRLLSLLLLLQARKRLKAGDLAERLQVSERTVYRDLDALSSAGVPVYAQRGPNGGVALLGEWRTSLTGLTEPEAQALAAVSVPGALSDIGLQESLRSSLIKLAASLPAVQQQAAEHARQRLLIDPTGWFQAKEAVPHLGLLREAVWQDRRVRLRYRNPEGVASERVVDPYGLVIKADRWYLVAGTSRGPSVFRGARVEGARRLAAPFTRPADFELGAFWRDWCRRFATSRPCYLVTLRLTAEGEEALRRERPGADQERLAAARREGDGRKVAAIDFEREWIAVSQLVPLGRGVEVVEPQGLRDRLRRIAEDLGAVYH